MIKIRAIDHVVLRTSQLEEMILFYRDVLGCSLERELAPEIGLVQLRAGDALIDLVSVDSELGRIGGAAPKMSVGGYNMDHLCLQLEPVGEDEIRSYLVRHGVEVGQFDERYGAQGFGPSLYITDPDGNTIELRERLQHHQDTPQS